MLNNAVRDRAWLILAVAAVFVLVFIFFTAAHPVVPYDCDDWRYLGQFRRPLPEMQQWNPSRVMPEVITPLAGSFAAFIVKPFVGDYVQAITVTVALSLAFFAALFCLALCQLFFALCRNKAVSAFSALLVLCLYFVFFKTQADCQYMLYSYNLTTIYFYTIPNVLNSILVCVLMRYIAEGTAISPGRLGFGRTAVLALCLYFAIFSMMFASVIIAVYCFYELLVGFFKKEKMRSKIILAVIFAGFLVYCYLELTGTRANTESGGSTNYSIFSMEFLSQLQVAYWNFEGLMRQANMALLAASLCVVFFALLHFALNAEKEKDNPLVRAGFVSLLACVSLIPALLVVGGKAGPGYCSLTHTMYGIFFFYMLLAVISLVYLTTKIKHASLALPFFLVLLFVEATDSGTSYMNQSYYSNDYFNHQINTAQKVALVNNWIEDLRRADIEGEDAVSISIPQAQGPDWPHSLEFFGEVFSHTLRSHGIISREIPVVLEPDIELTMSLAIDPASSYEDEQAENAEEEANAGNAVGN